MNKKLLTRTEIHVLILFVINRIIKGILDSYINTNKLLYVLPWIPLILYVIYKIWKMFKEKNFDLFE